MNLASVETATVEIVARHPRFAIPMYSGTHVNVAIDGNVATFPWGEHSVGVTPGRHYVVVWYSGVMNTGSQAEVWVEVEAGATARVTYCAPKSGRTQTGTIESDSTVAPPDGLPEDLRDLTDAQLIEAWNDFKELAGRDPIKRLMMRKMRAEFEQELERRGLAGNP